MLIKKLAHQLSKYDDIIFDLDNTLFDQSDYDIGAFKEIEKHVSAFECISTSDVANLLHSVNILNHEQRNLFIEYIDFRVANLTQLLKQQMGITSQIGLNFSA